MKKASLQLGISTIVVLVIAMVLIAGGIAFIRGFLGQGTEALTQAFDITDFTIQPDNENPLVFAEGNTISIKSGDRETIKIGLLNSDPTPGKFFLTMSASDCVSASGANNGKAPQITSLPKDLKSGEGQVFNIFITAETAPPTSEPLGKDDYLCVLHAKKGGITGEEYASTDAVINVYI